MLDRDPIHTRIADTYTKAARSTTAGCSCGCDDDPLPKGAVAKWANYGDDQLTGLPADAVQNSFGCGNPLAFSQVQPGDTVLDLGSGAGIDLLIAARMVGPTGRVIGVDMTDEMIERARANAIEAGYDTIDVRKGLIESLPVDDASVDWVISNCVINLSPDKPAVFREIARVLKSGGRMLVSDLVAEGLSDHARNHPAIYDTCIGGAISEAEYLQGMRDAGLAEVNVVERLDYDRRQLTALAESEIGEAAVGGTRDTGSRCGCCGTVDDDALMDEVFQARVTSIRVFGRKP